MSKLFNRIIWQINRSPFRTLIKVLVRTANPEVVRHRTVMARDLPLNTTVDPALKQLNENGYCVITNLIDKDLLADMVDCAVSKLTHAELPSQNQRRTGKEFWIRLLDEEMMDGKLHISSPYMRFAVQPKVLQMASRT